MNQAAAVAPTRVECRASDALIKILGPIVALHGYTKVQRTVQGGKVLSTAFKNVGTDATLDGLMKSPCVEVYRRDMWPNDRGEIFLYVWNFVGSPSVSQCNALVDLLNRVGHKARRTKHKGDVGVRVVLQGFSMYAIA